MYDQDENDGRFPDESLVEVRYPRTEQEERGDRSAWPWLPASIMRQCGPDEWLVCVMEPGLARLRHGRRAPAGTSSLKLYYPVCNQDASEIGGRSR